MASTVEIIINAKDNASKVLGGVGDAIGGIAKAAGALAIGAGVALGGFLVSSVNDAMEAENAMAQLNAVIKSTGGAAGVTAQQVSDMAGALSEQTRFTDEAVMSGASMLLTFTNIGQNVFPQATETILDMSQALGQDLQSSAIQLGKALNNPIEGITALRRVGVAFTDEQEKMIKGLVEAGKLEEAQAIILKELQTEFGGSAKAAGETFAGQMDILKNKISNLKEGIGMALMPTLQRLGDMFSSLLANPAVLQFIDSFASGIASLSETLLNLFTSGKAFDLSFVTAMFSNWAGSVDWAGLSQSLAAGINSIDWNAVGLEIRTGFLNIMNGLQTIVSEVDWGALASAVGSALAGVFAGLYGYANIEQLGTDFMNGFVYIGLVISTTVQGWVTAFQTTLSGLLTSAQAVMMGLVTTVKNYLMQLISAGLEAGRGFVKSIVDGIRSAASSIYNAVKSIIDTIKKMFNSMVINIPGVGTGSGGGSTGGGGGGANGPGFASGGIASGPRSGHWELLHGTEGVFTRDQMAMLAPVGGGGGGVVINLTYAPAVSTASEAELERALLPLILKGVKQAQRY